MKYFSFNSEMYSLILLNICFFIFVFNFVFCNYSVGATNDNEMCHIELVFLHA